MKKLLLLAALLCFGALQCVCTNTKLQVGDVAPDFELINQDGETVRLSDMRGKRVALYFYPKDSTPGCTQQACSIRDSFESLKDENIVVLGLSKGSVKSKQRFIKKYGLTFPLLIATNSVLQAYGVNTRIWQLFLPKRRTFLIDENGIIVAIIEKIDTKKHAQQILEAFDAVQ